MHTSSQFLGVLKWWFSDGGSSSVGRSHCLPPPDLNTALLFNPSFTLLQALLDLLFSKPHVILWLDREDRRASLGNHGSPLQNSAQTKGPTEYQESPPPSTTWMCYHTASKPLKVACPPLKERSWESLGGAQGKKLPRGGRAQEWGGRKV